MVVRMRHTRGHTRNRRSHHKLENPRFSTEGSSVNLRHRASLTSGTYRGRIVIDKVAQAEKKAARAKAKAKERGEDPSQAANPEALPEEKATEKSKGKKS